MNDMTMLKERLSAAREAQKAADTAIGLVEGLVASLEDLGVHAKLDISGADQPSALVVVSFAIHTGAIVVADPADDLAPWRDAKPVSSASSEPDPEPAASVTKHPDRSRRSLKRWTKDEVQTAVRMKDAGKTAREIAAALGRPLAGVKSKLQEINASAPPEKARKQAPRWSAEEITTAKRMLRDGAGPRAISEAVGRPLPATNFKLRRLRAEVAEEDAACEPKPAQDKAVEQSKPQCTPLMRPPVSDAGSFTERQIDARLDAIGYSDGWDANLDLEMVELLAGGTSALDAATILETTRNKVIERFRTLCPNATIDEQQKLLVVLRRRAGRSDK